MANEINLTQLCDKDGYSIYPNLPLKTINEEELYGNGNLTIEGGNMEYGYANTSTGLNDNNINDCCYKNEDDAPKWEKYFWAIIDENDKDDFPYMWARTKVDENSYSYNLWGSIVDVSYEEKDKLECVFVQGGVLMVYVKKEKDSSTYVIAEKTTIKSIIRVEKNGGEDVSISSVDIDGETIKGKLLSEGDMSIDGSLSENKKTVEITFTFNENSKVKSPYGDIDKEIEIITESGETLYVRPQVLFIDKSDAEIENDENNVGVVIFDLNPNVGSITLDSSNCVFPFEGDYKEYEISPILYYGSTIRDIDENDISISFDSSSYEKINSSDKDVKYEISRGKDEKTIIKISIPQDIKFKKDNLQFDFTITKKIDNEEYTRKNSFLLIGVKSGDNGQDANILTIDLSNDYEQVFVDANNKILEKQDCSIVAQLYVGDDIQQIEGVSITENEIYDASYIISDDKEEVTIIFDFIEGAEFNSNKIAPKITLTHGDASNPDLYGLSKSINFNLLKLQANADNSYIDYNLIVTPTSIKYIYNTDTESFDTYTKEISVKIKKYEDGSVSDSSYLPDGYYLKYNIDDDSYHLDADGSEGGKLPVIKDVSLPNQLAEFHLYKKGDNNENDILIDYANVDCLYDASLPIMYDFTCNGITSIFVNNQGQPNVENIPITLSKTIGSETTYYTRFQTSEFEDFYFGIGIDDNSDLNTSKHFEENDGLFINIKDLYKDYNIFDTANYIEIKLINGKEGEVGTTVDTERIHFVRNIQQETKYVLDFGDKDSISVGVATNTGAINSSLYPYVSNRVQFDLPIRVLENGETMNISDSSVKYSYFDGSTSQDKYVDISNGVVRINILKLFFESIGDSIPLTVTVNYGTKEEPKPISGIISLIATNESDTWEIVAYDTTFNYDGAGNYIGLKDSNGNPAIKVQIQKNGTILNSNNSSTYDRYAIYKYAERSPNDLQSSTTPVGNIPAVLQMQNSSTGFITISFDASFNDKNYALIGDEGSTQRVKNIMVYIGDANNRGVVYDYVNIDCIFSGKDGSNGENSEIEYLYVNAGQSVDASNDISKPDGGDNIAYYIDGEPVYWASDLSIKSGMTTYVSSRVKIGDEYGDWSDVAKLQDGNVIQVEYSKDYTGGYLDNFGYFVDTFGPNDPSYYKNAEIDWRNDCSLRGSGTWSDNVDGATHMAICQFTNSNWSEWQIIKLQGDGGRRGKIVYSAGEWSADVTYKATDTTTPYVSYNGKYYVLKEEGEGGITGDEYNPYNGTYWEEMSSFNAVYAELLIAKYGNVGGAVFYDDSTGNRFMFSQNGKEGDTNSSNYQNFLVDSSNNIIINSDSYKKDYLKCIRENSKFIPNVLINFANGDAWYGNGKIEMLKDGIFNVYDSGNQVTTAIYGGGTSKYQIIDIVNDGEDSTKEVTYKAIQTIGKEEKRTLYKYKIVESSIYTTFEEGMDSANPTYKPGKRASITDYEDYNTMVNNMPTIYIEGKLSENVYTKVVFPKKYLKGEYLVFGIYESIPIIKSYSIDEDSGITKMYSPDDVSIKTVMETPVYTGEGGYITESNYRGSSEPIKFIVKDTSVNEKEIYFAGGGKTAYLLVEDVNKGAKWIYELESETSITGISKPDTIFYEDGYVEANNILCRNGYFEGELKGSGSFDGIVNTSNAIIGNMIVNNDNIDINSNMHINPNYNVGNDINYSSLISYKYDIKNKKNSYVYLNERVVLSSVLTPNASGNVVYIPPININITKYTNTKSTGLDSKKIDIVLSYSTYDASGNATKEEIINYSINGSTKDKWLPLPTGKRCVDLITTEAQEIEITDSSKCKKMELILEFKTILEDKGFFDYDTFHIKVEPNEKNTTYDVEKPNDGNKVITVPNNCMSYVDFSTTTSTKLDIPQFYASDKGFWFISGTGSKLIIDSAGIRILDTSGNLQKDFG